ncbi:MAG: hypothetical protein U0804_09240 [Gemmataceae bacterium]
MRRLTWLVVCAALGGGCKDDKSDNTKIQTPNDAPIGAPNGMGDRSVGQVKGREAPLTP